MPSTYSNEQIDKYLEFISIPDPFRRANNPRPNLEFLRILHTHQLCTIPFEALALHYSEEREVDLDPQAIYHKFVSPNGRGGYCIEQALFFNYILRALGFRAYLAGGRVRPRIDGTPSGGYMGWVHCINIVTFEDGSRYMTDVGYGGDCPIAPLPLVEGVIAPNLSTQEVRLMHMALPEQTDPDQKYWVYEFRNHSSKDFNACYCFLDKEFLQADYEVMSFYVNQSPKSYMSTTVVAVRFLHQDHKIYGKRMLVNTEVKENTGGRTETIKVCTSESQRVEVLSRDFGILLSREEQQAIYKSKLALE